MPFSTEVSTGDTVLDTQYNNLRKDIIDIDGGHDHAPDEDGFIPIPPESGI